MRTDSKFALLFLALVVALAAPVVLAQTGTTSVRGEVTDPKDAVISGAKVTLTSVETGATRTATTDENGRYQFLALPPGTYDLQVEHTGFRTAKFPKLRLLVNTPHSLNPKLELGQMAETVVVNEMVTPLNTTDASLGTVLSGNQISNLPMEARNVVGLLSLQPGAVFLPTGNAPCATFLPAAEQRCDTRSGAVSGARSDQSNVTLDGVDVNDPQFSTAYTTVLRMTLDSVQEFRVTTSSYDATQGRSSAAQINLVTKSGTNEVHGSAYWAHRNTATSTNEYFLKLAQLEARQQSKSPKLQKHVYGVSAGGPLWKDRFFLFGNFENLRESSQSPVSRFVPSGSFRDGVLIYQCATATACPATSVSGFSSTHNIPAGYFGLTPANLRVIDPLGLGSNVGASNYFRQYPTPNEPGRDGIDGTTTGNIVGFRFASPIANDFYTYIARADFKIDRAGNHTLFWRGNLQDDVIGSPAQFPGQPPNTTGLINNKGMAIGYTALITPNFINSFRYGFTRISETTQGLRTANVATFRFLSDFNALTPTFGRLVPTHNLVNDMTYTHGAHTTQWGINFRRTRIPRFTNAGSFHTAVANGSWVSGVGRTFMPGAPACAAPAPCSVFPAVSSGGQGVYADSFINILGILSQVDARYNYNKDGSTLAVGAPVPREYGSDEYEFYVQNAWKIRSNLTFTFGVRYSLLSPPWEVNGLQVAPNVSFGELFNQRARNAAKGIPSNAIPPITIDLAGPANGRKGFYSWDYNNWAPRASFAYSPKFSDGWLGWLTGNGKTVIRGGYSLVYDRIGQALATQFDAVGSFGLSTLLSSPFGGNNEDNPAIRFVNINTIPSTLPAAPPGGFPQTPPIAAGVIQSSIDDTITTPYSHSFNFAIGRELPGNLAVEAAYVGRRGRGLLIRRDIVPINNLVDPASGMDYYTAAGLAIRAAAGIPSGAPRSAYAGIANIPYWQNLFPDANIGAGLTATQEVARRFNRDNPDFTTSIWLMDQFCFPACSRFGPFAYFNDQYDSLAVQSSLATSEYHGLQLTLRKRMSNGLQFDLNYTFSKSNDMGSGVERGSSFTTFSNGGYTGFLLNPINPRQNYAASDFDARHQININSVYELPVGRGQRFAASTPGWLNQIIGGWAVAGIYRHTSGFPFNVINCRSCWPTNWNLQGNAELATAGVLPPLGTTRNAVGGRPSPFRDPKTALAAFRRALPGEVGLRNKMRGDGYFVIDTGVSKTWKMPYAESHSLKFRWETFNLTNTPRFDTSNITATPDISASFGRYNGTLATCDGLAGRCMQFALRYEF